MIPGGAVRESKPPTKKAMRRGAVVFQVKIELLCKKYILYYTEGGKGGRW